VAGEAAQNALRKEWFMRRFKRTYIVAGLVLMAALAISTSSWATHPGHVFTADLTLTGKAKNGKPAPAVFHFGLKGADDPATPNDQAPPKATTIAIALDEDVNVSTKGFKPCTADLESTSTEQAIAACPKSIAGTGSAEAVVGGSPLPPGKVTAFIGPNNTLIGHVRIDAISVTQVIPVAIQPASDQSLYKQQLFINVPQLAGGAGSLTALDFTLQKKEKKKKKNGTKKIYSLFSAQCTDGVWNFLNNETYSDHEPISEPFTQTCQK
jgi:hypothetical protein